MVVAYVTEVDTMQDLIEKGFYTTLGAWLLVHEKADEIMKDMVAKGREAPEGSKHMIDEMSRRVDDEKEEVKAWFSDAVAMALRDSGVATKEHIDALSSRIDEIEGRLAVVEAKEISIEKKQKR